MDSLLVRIRILKNFVQGFLRSLICTILGEMFPSTQTSFYIFFLFPVLCQAQAQSQALFVDNHVMSYSRVHDISFMYFLSSCVLEGPEGLEALLFY